MGGGSVVKMVSRRKYLDTRDKIALYFRDCLKKGTYYYYIFNFFKISLAILMKSIFYNFN